MARKKVPAQQDNTPSSQHEPSQAELDLLAANQAAKAASLPAPKVRGKVNKKGILEISLDRIGSAIIENALATTSESFLGAMINSLGSALAPKDSQNPQTAINLGLSLVTAIKPRDELETMLAVQMAAVHVATITFARRLNHVDNIPQQDSAERALNKLARTFACQMEALRKHRNGGTQKVIVQHINVEDGAQAVIGHVEQTTRGEG
jgi:hypothetical protein